MCVLMPLIFSEIHNDTKLNDKFPLHLCLCFRDARPLVNVIKNGDLKALKEIVKRNPMSLLIPNEKGWISLHEAAYYGQKECLKIILRGESEIKTSVIENGFYFIHTGLESQADLLSVHADYFSFSWVTKFCCRSYSPSWYGEHMW